MAYSIIGAVWGVIVYLLVQIVKLKKLGKEKVAQSQRTAVLQD